MIEERLGYLIEARFLSNGHGADAIDDEQKALLVVLRELRLQNLYIECLL